MVAQNKSLPYGTGAGMGWILANITSKEFVLMQRQQEFERLHQQQKPHQPQDPQKQQYRGRVQKTQ